MSKLTISAKHRALLAKGPIEMLEGWVEHVDAHVHHVHASADGDCFLVIYSTSFPGERHHSYHVLRIFGFKDTWMLSADAQWKDLEVET